MANERADELLTRPARFVRKTFSILLREDTPMEKTETRTLAEDYLKLGGTRQVMIDDNKTFIRQYEDEPREAAVFWQEHIESLDQATREDVEFFLPSINADGNTETTERTET
ncbi:hypothetical protein D3C80_1500520 [compost metagenome]